MIDIIMNKSKRRIIFINRYFFPDHSATSQILSDLAFYLSSQGYHIEIITSRQQYTNSDARFNKSEVINGVQVNRIWTTRFGRHNLLGRAVDYLSFYYSAGIYLLFNLHSSDIAIAKTDPPLISIIAASMCKLKGASLINWTQDLFPEIAKSLEVKGITLIYPLLLALRNYSLKTAYMNIAIGEKMSELLQSEGINKNNIKVIHNWSIEDNIVPLDASDNPLRVDWDMHDKFIVGYSGNIGRAHEFTTLIESAKSLANDPGIVFVIIGGGAQYNVIKQQTNDLGLKNVIFKPYQSKDMLKYSLTLPDLHVISLRPELEGLIVPSKFYGIAASGRPVLFIGDKNGEIPCILKENNCGETVLIGDVQSTIEFIEKLKSDKSLANTMGCSATEVFNKKYRKKRAYESWNNILSKLINDT